MAEELSYPVSAWPKLKIILIYTLLGPMIGGVVFLFGAFITDFDHLVMSNVDRDVRAILKALPPIFVLSFVFGGAQALSTGLFLAYISDAKGQFSFAMALLSAFIVGLIATIILMAVWGNVGVAIALFLAAIGIISSLILRFLFRGSFRQPQSEHHQER